MLTVYIVIGFWVVVAAIWLIFRNRFSARLRRRIRRVIAAAYQQQAAENQWQRQFYGTRDNNLDPPDGWTHIRH